MSPNLELRQHLSERPMEGFWSIMEQSNKLVAKYLQKYPHLQIFSEKTDKEILRALLVGEAVGEPEEGIRAICHVVLNRVARAKLGLIFGWSKTIAGACLMPHQFSCFYSDFKLREKDILTALEGNRSSFGDKLGLIIDIIDELLDHDRHDITDGADHYFNPKIVMPSWAAKMRFTKRIGGHDFYDSLKS